MLVHLVRHGRPIIDESVHPSMWTLDPDALEDIQLLRQAGVLPADAPWYSSSEPKAIETAVLLAGAVQVVKAFDEAERDGFLPHDEFHEALRLAFQFESRPAQTGWEPLSHVRRRVANALFDLVDKNWTDEIVVVGHATAWVVLVSELTGERPSLSARQEMLLPDHCAVDLESGRVLGHWGDWL